MKGMPAAATAHNVRYFAANMNPTSGTAWMEEPITDRQRADAVGQPP